MVRRSLIVASLFACLGCAMDAPSEPVELAVTIENISRSGALVASDGTAVDVVFAPGVWALYPGDDALFTPGSAATAGLEAVAEEGVSHTLIQETDEGGQALASGVFGTFDENVSYEEMPIGPGAEVVFVVRAAPGAHLSLAFMFVQSNDVFVAPAGGSLALFDEHGAPIEGDVTAAFRLWDAGTEMNEEPGIGMSQAPRQAESGDGAAEGGVVRTIGATDDAGHSYPPIPEILRVTVERI